MQNLVWFGWSKTQKPGSLGISLVLVLQCWWTPALASLGSIMEHNCQTVECQTCDIRSLMLCSRSSILDPMSSILEIIWSDMVWNLRQKMKIQSRHELLDPTCPASAGACSGCSWSARPRSWDPAGRPLLCSRPPFPPCHLPLCRTFSLRGLLLWN